MRILYLISGYGQAHLGGLIHREMALEIRARGHDYTIFAPASAPREGEAEPFDEGLVVLRPPSSAGLWRIAGSLLRPLLHQAQLPGLVSQVAQALGKHGPFQVVVAEGAYPMGVVAWLATRVVPVPYVVSVIGGDFLANGPARYGHARHLLPRKLMGLALRSAAAVRAITPYAAEGAVRLGGSPEKVAVVQRNIAATAFPPEALDVAAFRREARRLVGDRLGLNDVPLVVAAGRLLPIKGFDVLVRSLALLPDSLARTHLLLVGPDRPGLGQGSHRGYLEALARRLGVADRLRFSGAVPLPQIREYLAAADVVAVPSLEEGGNKVLLEAAAVGTPVVGSRTAGNAEWALRWECGRIVEPGSAEALADALRAILLDPALARSMGRNGTAFARLFRTPVVARRILDLCAYAERGGALPAELREPRELAGPIQADVPA